MRPFQIAVATRCFRLPLRDALKAAADLGVRGVQFDVRDELSPQSLTETGRRQFLHQLDSMGLKVASLTFPTRRSFYNSDLLDARVQATKESMLFARQLGASVLTVKTGQVPEAGSKEFQLLNEVLTDLAAHGNHVGTTLSLTPSQDDPKKLVSLLSEIRSGPLGVDFDPADFELSAVKPESAFRTLYQFITHFLARDSIRMSEGGGVETALGRGGVDWVGLLPLLHEINYTGWVTVERTQGDDRPGDMARGVKFLEEVLM